MKFYERIVTTVLLAAVLAPATGLCAQAASVKISTAAPSIDKTYEQLQTLVDVLNYISENYVDETDTQKLIYGAAAGMVRTLDPFSQFMEPEISREIKSETQGEFGGVGLRLTTDNGWLTVLTPLPGTPAYRAGILPEDRISHIEGQSAEDMNLDEALKKLRDAPGTKVKLTILRAPDNSNDENAPWTPHEYTLTRENVKIDSVDSWRIAGSSVGYVRIAEFSAKTNDDVSAALEKRAKEGCESLVLDLRNNPGGLLSSAIDVSAQFLDGNKLIVYTQGRKSENHQEFHAPATAPYARLPLIVLINGGSASGAEIVAGALQDHHRAVIMGMRSFGKASVQSVIPLNDSSGLRLTVARYYTPSGRSIHRDEKNKTGGILPDIEVSITADAEAKLYAQWDVIYAKDKKPRSKIKPEDTVRDETLDRAVDMLKARAALKALTAQ